MVYPVPGQRNAGKRALMVLRLKAQVSLDHHHDLRVPEHLALPDPHDMTLAERKLLVRLCQRFKL